MRFEADISYQNIKRSFVWKILERIVSQGVNLIIQIVLARILLPEQFGSLAIMIAIVNYLGIFVQSGLGAAIIQKEDVDDMDISTLFTASISIAMILYVILFIFAPLISSYYNENDLVWPLRVLALGLFLNSINAIQTGILSRRMQFKTIFFRSLFAIPISGGVGISMAYAGFGIWALVFQSLLNSLIVVIVMSFGKDMRIKFDFSRSRAKRLYSFSVKILTANLVSGLHDTLRTMIIGKRYSKSELAYYDKAYAYSNYLAQIINGSISSVLLPVFSRKQNDSRKLKELARQSCRLASFCMFPLLLGAAAVAKPLVLGVLTEKWIFSVPYLTIFCILRLPGCIMAIDKQVFYALGKSNIDLQYEIVLLCVNIIVLLSTAKYGIWEVAIGATLVEFSGGLAICIISSRVYAYTLKERFIDLWRASLNSVVMFIGVRILVNKIQDFSNLFQLVICIALGVLIYAILAIITRDKSLITIRKILGEKNC